MAIGSAVSHSTYIRFGVPQCSVLGGTLFTIYIASLPSETATDGVTIDGFSDDTQARMKLSLGPNISSSQLCSPTSALSSWCLKCERFFFAHRVKLNIGKTVVFLVAPKSKSGSLPTLSLTIGSTFIAPVSQCLNLGVIFDSELTMAPHVKNACKSAFFHLRTIARIRNFLNLPATKALVHAFVLSRLDYCNSLPHRTAREDDRLSSASSKRLRPPDAT